METSELINKFFESGSIAVIGASGNKAKFGSQVFAELLGKGFDVLPVNPNREFINEIKCYNSVSALPSSVENAVFVIPPSETNKVVQQLLSTSIRLVWMQQGSESEEAIGFCRENNIEVIHKKCILMYAPPVKSFHKFHRNVWRFIGRL